MSYACTFLPVWLYVALAVDRYIFMSCPERRFKLCTTLRSKIVISLLVTIAVVVYLNISLLSGVIETGSRKICVPLPWFSHQLQALDKLDAFINLLVPHLVVIIMVILTSRHVTFCSTSYSATPSSDRRGHRPSSWPKTEAHFTRSLLVVLLAFLVFNLPSDILRLCVMFKSLHTGEYRLSTTIILWQQVLLHLYFTRFSINFILYYTFSQTFRRSFKLMFVDCYQTCTLEPLSRMIRRASSRKSPSSTSSAVVSNNSTHLQFFECSSV